MVVDAFVFKALPTLVFLLAISGPAVGGMIGLGALANRLRVVPRYVVWVAWGLWLVALLITGRGMILSIGALTAKPTQPVGDDEPSTNLHALSLSVAVMFYTQMLVLLVLAVGYVWTLYWIWRQPRATR